MPLSLQAARLAPLAALVLGTWSGCTPASAQDDPQPGPEGGDSEEVRRAEGQGDFLPLTFHTADFKRRADEYLKLEARRGDTVRIVPQKGVIEGDEVVVFDTRVDPVHDEYVYLLETTGGAPRHVPCGRSKPARQADVAPVRPSSTSSTTSSPLAEVGRVAAQQSVRSC